MRNIQGSTGVCERGVAGNDPVCWARVVCHPAYEHVVLCLTRRCTMWHPRRCFISETNGQPKRIGACLSRPPLSESTELFPDATLSWRCSLIQVTFQPWSFDTRIAWGWTRGKHALGQRQDIGSHEHLIDTLHFPALIGAERLGDGKCKEVASTPTLKLGCAPSALLTAECSPEESICDGAGSRCVCLPRMEGSALPDETLPQQWTPMICLMYAKAATSRRRSSNIEVPTVECRRSSVILKVTLGSINRPPSGGGQRQLAMIGADQPRG